MAVLIRQEVRPTAEVVQSTVVHYTRRQEPVVESWLTELTGEIMPDELGFLSCIAAVDRRVVEVVVAPTTDMAGLNRAVWRLSARGWGVFVLVPSERLGDAHAVLRGTPCTLQGWWLETGRPTFGRFERP